MSSETATTSAAVAADLGVEAQLERLRAGAITATELTELALARAEWLQPILRPFRCLLHGQARTAAAEADRRLGSGEDGALLGVPVAIKDDVDLAGETTPFGCGGFDQMAAEDSELVRRLRVAGAVIIGKTMTPEIGQWPFSESEAFGAARNPWNPAYSPGGSSGGAAAAVAAGIVAAAIGSDGAGSIRIPAAWCGLVGLKPQRGRVSTWPHVDAFQGLACYGPITRSATDAALVLDAISGNHVQDVAKPPQPLIPFRESASRDPGQLRIAISFATPPGAPSEVDPEIRAAIEWLGDTLRTMGHLVVNEDPSYSVVGPQIVIRGACGISDWVEVTRASESELERRTQTAVRVGRALRRGPLKLARAGERRTRQSASRIFADVDVVLTPTTAQMPPRVGQFDGVGWWPTSQAASAACPFAWAWNVVGWPAINVPAGTARNGLPIGAQLLGGEGAEPTLLALANQLEEQLGWLDARPPVPAVPTSAD